MSETVTISEFMATCERMLDDVQQTGKALVVTRKGVPIALICPLPATGKIEGWIGSMKDHIKIIGDIVSPASDESEWETLKD